MRVVRSDHHRHHHVTELDGGQLVPSWEHPGRADTVDAALDDAGYECIEPNPVDRGLVETVHAPDYLAFLETAHQRWVADGRTATDAMAFGWPARRMLGPAPEGLDGQLGYYSFAADCSIGPHTFQAALASAATAQTAADLVADGAPSAFGRCRPPGHHATRDQFGGYCYLNNAAIAAQRLRDRGYRTVAVLDVDYHHGNGTQDIFYERADVLVASLHADPAVEFPYFTGHASETGNGEGQGRNRNIPLPRGTGIDRWLAALESAMAWIVGLGAEATVVSLGLDTFQGDPISSFSLESADFVRVGQALGSLEMPMVFVFEGGYATEQLGTNTVQVLQGFES